MSSNELLPSLERLIVGHASLDDLNLLRQALAGGQITIASEGGVGGNVKQYHRNFMNKITV